MDCKTFTIFLRFNVRIIRLLIFRNCSLQRLLEYAGNQFDIKNTLLTAKDTFGNFITNESFSRILLNQGIKCVTLRIQPRTSEVKEHSQIKFRGYLNLLNQRKQTSLNQSCHVDISIKAKTVYRQNCFIGVARKTLPQKSSAVLRQSSFIGGLEPIQRTSTTVFRQNSFIDVQSSGEMESPLAKRKNVQQKSTFAVEGSSAAKRRKVQHNNRVKYLRI